MASNLQVLCVDAHDPARLARFWADVLGGSTVQDDEVGVLLVPIDDTGNEFCVATGAECRQT